MQITADPVLNVLLYATLAAVAAALGALPSGLGLRPPPSWLGVANALAGGLMLGAGYLLMCQGLGRQAFVGVGGAALGVAYTWWVRGYTGLDDLDGRPGLETAPDFGYKVILETTLHAAAEGVAIGVAMGVDTRLGVFLASALAVHNVGEALVLTAVLERRGITPRAAAGLCVITRVTEPLLAVFVFALVPTLGSFLPGLLGFSAGTLLFLVLTELVPASYERADRRLVALVVSAAAAAVVFLESFFKNLFS